MVESDGRCSHVPSTPRSVHESNHFHGQSISLTFILELEFEWHKIRLVMAEMIHFIRQLEAYCRLEVIECSWNALIDFLNKKEGDLDALIDSHCTYLDRMTKKILLWNSKPGKEVCTTDSLLIFPNEHCYRKHSSCS